MIEYTLVVGYAHSSNLGRKPTNKTGEGVVRASSHASGVEYNFMLKPPFNKLSFLSNASSQKQPFNKPDKEKNNDKI